MDVVFRFDVVDELCRVGVVDVFLDVGVAVSVFVTGTVRGIVGIEAALSLPCVRHAVAIGVGRRAGGPIGGKSVMRKVFGSARNPTCIFTNRLCNPCRDNVTCGEVGATQVNYFLISLGPWFGADGS